jgi:hypothetical protein
MPRKPRQIKRNLVEQEGRIQLAIQALKKSEIPSCRRAAAIFDVPESTLRGRVKGQQFQAELRGHKHRLTETQEDALIKWIISRDKRGVPPRHSHVREMAEIVLQGDSKTLPQPIGPNWVTNFIKRHPEVKSRFARRYNYQRALLEDPKVVNTWFEDLKAQCDEKGILEEDIYNFDETGFAMGLIATARVVT